MMRFDQVITWLIVLVGIRLGLSAVLEFGRGVAPWETAFWLLNAGSIRYTGYRSAIASN